MRKAIFVMAGFLLAIGGVAGPLRSEAADACSLSGTYNLSGLAEAGVSLSVVGNLIFTPNGACTGGSVGGSVTAGLQNQAAATVALAGTYSVTSDGVVAVSASGLQLTGRGSLMGGNVYNAVHFVVTLDPPQPLSFAATATRNPPTGLSTVVDRSPGVIALSATNLTTPAYSFTVPANTLVGGKLLRGRLLYDYTNNSGTVKDLGIQLVFGGANLATQTLSGVNTGFGFGELEFFIGDVLSSQFQNGGFRGVHQQPNQQRIPWQALGSTNANVTTPLQIQILIQMQADPNLIFGKLSVVLELI